MRARGCHAGGASMRRIKIGFDEETFSDIATTAARRNIPFAERVRELVELGRETEKQGEAG